MLIPAVIAVVAGAIIGGILLYYGVKFYMGITDAVLCGKDVKFIWKKMKLSYRLV